MSENKIITGLKEALAFAKGLNRNVRITTPFDRVPICACDPGKGDAPSRLKRLECRMRGGPCSPSYKPTEADITPASRSGPIS